MLSEDVLLKLQKGMIRKIKPAVSTIIHETATIIKAKFIITLLKKL